MNLHITPSFNIDRLCKTSSVLLFLVYINNLRASQRMPTYPGSHVHWKPWSPNREHVPFLHGWQQHRSTAWTMNIQDCRFYMHIFWYLSHDQLNQNLFYLFHFNLVYIIKHFLIQRSERYISNIVGTGYTILSIVLLIIFILKHDFHLTPFL